MSPEFDIDAYIRENMPNEQDEQVSFNLATEHMLPIGIFLQARIGSRQKRFDEGLVDPSERTVNLEDSIAVLAERFGTFMSDIYQESIDFSISQRERDDLGGELLSSTSPMSSIKFVRGFREPVYRAFLKIDSHFVDNGGSQNPSLREELESTLKAII